MVSLRRVAMSACVALILFVTACHNTDSDVATSIVDNDLPYTITVVHCASSCSQTADEGVVESHGTFRANIGVPGFETYVIEHGGALSCLHVTYKGPGDGSISTRASTAQPIDKRSECK